MVDSAATLRIRGMFSKVPASVMGVSWLAKASNRRRGAEVLLIVWNWNIGSRVGG